MICDDCIHKIVCAKVYSDDWCAFKQTTETINAVIIPDNATNGDMIMALFDVKEVRKYRTRVTAWLSSVNPIDFQLNWWNAPYKKGESNEKDKTDN